MSVTVRREDLAALQGMSPRLLQALEALFVSTGSAEENASGAINATRAIQDATVLVLSSNEAFGNERVVVLDPGAFEVADGGAGGSLNIALVNLIQITAGFMCAFNLEADTNLELPSTGRVVSSLESGLGNYMNDAAAGAAGIPVGGMYHNGGDVRVRVS